MNLRHPKEFYTNYIADSKFDEIDRILIDFILQHKPESVYEFGCGSGKNLMAIAAQAKCETWGQDISVLNCMNTKLKGVDCVIIGDERHMPLRQFDVSFTCSVLDHITPESIEQVIGNLVACATKAVYIFEARVNNPENFYWNHDYEKYGFQKLLSCQSAGDGYIYDLLMLSK
jgi:ubiquinone/menaquinone biosynthesis C-methylase UbiE